MSANRLMRGPFWAALVAALLAAVVAFFVFAQSGEAATDDQPTYASVTPRIIGGTEVPNGKYPFMVYLQILITSPKQEQILSCGGSLIDKDSVLTAGHCFPGLGTNSLLEFRVQAYVGRTVRSSDQGQVRSVKTISVHPAYRGAATSYSYDAAVVNLTRPVSGIAPIKLATSSQNGLEKPGRNATVAGWGDAIVGSQQVPGGPEFPDRMHEVQVPIVSDSRADKAWEGYDIGGGRSLDYVPPLMVAAAEKDKGACHGDSGGPLFSALESDGTGDTDDGDDGGKGGSGGKYTQIGIVSHGVDTCGGKLIVPDTYTEVNAPSIRSFITDAASK